MQNPPPQTQVTRRGANHTLHIILTLCTCGLWAVTGWPIAAIMGRKTKTVVYPPQQPGPYYPPQQGQYPPQQQWPPRQ